MTSPKNVNRQLQLVVKLLSHDLGVDRSSVDHEVQDDGRFLLFRVHRITPAVYDEKVRGSIYAQIMGQLGGIEAKWMVVFLENDVVVDVIDSIVGY